jgi:prephenate dehydrogenase
MTTMTNAPFGRVHIIGAGLLGASIGLALRDQDVVVTLADASPSAVALASDYGAGVALAPSAPAPDLVVVAVPPDVAMEVTGSALEQFPAATVIDVTSVKAGIYQGLTEAGADTTRFVGTHPMAGRERGGAVSARSDLFTARPWVICEGEAGRLSQVESFIRSLGATPITMSALEHDRAVALMSHTPQLLSSVMAARLSDASPVALSLAGGGIRDVTRIAASDPALWIQIVQANAEAISEYLQGVKADVDRLLGALGDLGAAGSRSTIAELLQAGNAGVSQLPGKHGVSTTFASLIVVIDDTPGQLAKLLTQLGDWGVNLEDLRLEHSPGANVGFADLTVKKDVVAEVEFKLIESGWRIAGEAK